MSDHIAELIELLPATCCTSDAITGTTASVVSDAQNGALQVLLSSA